MAREYTPYNPYYSQEDLVENNSVTASEISGASIRSRYIKSPLRSETLPTINIRSFDELKSSPTNLNSIIEKLTRPSLQFPHIGVGEKGPASRYIANNLGTYASESAFSAVKALFRTLLKTAGKEEAIRLHTHAKALYKDISGVLPGISEKKFIFALKSPGKAFKTMQRQLQRRGISEYVIASEATKSKQGGIIKSNLKPFEGKAQRIRAYNTPVLRGMPTGEKLATANAYSELKHDIFKYPHGAQITQLGAPKHRIYDPSSISRAKHDIQYLTPTINFDAIEVDTTQNLDRIHSHVNLRIKNAKIDTDLIDKALASKVKNGY